MFGAYRDVSSYDISVSVVHRAIFQYTYLCVRSSDFQVQCEFARSLGRIPPRDRGSFRSHNLMKAYGSTFVGSSVRVNAFLDAFETSSKCMDLVQIDIIWDHFVKDILRYSCAPVIASAKARYDTITNCASLTFSNIALAKSRLP